MYVVLQSSGLETFVKGWINVVYSPDVAKGKKVKADIALHGNPSQSYWTPLAIWIIQCYPPPDTSKRAPPNPSHAGWYSIYIPRRDGRLS